MINKNSENSLPFILTYAERMNAEGPLFPLCYNRDSQTSQVEVNGRWMGATDAGCELGSTLITAVHQETTDDD